jgi:hypothetical protein
MFTETFIYLSMHMCVCAIDIILYPSFKSLDYVCDFSESLIHQGVSVSPLPAELMTTMANWRCGKSLSAEISSMKLGEEAGGVIHLDMGKMILVGHIMSYGSKSDLRRNK